MGRTADADVSTLRQRLTQVSDQQEAISEILNVMSRSPGDVRPVLDAVAERAARLCEAPFARVLLVEGDVLRTGAEYSIDGTPHGGAIPLPLKRSSIAGRAVLDQRPVHHADIVPLLETEYPDAVNARALGLRAVLAIPLISDGSAYGAIILFRREPRTFAPNQIVLVETFARQAAIAIKHARLFTQTKEALERQTATSEILRVISQSPTDVQPVFETIVKAAHQLCDGHFAHVFTYDGSLLHLAAISTAEPTHAKALQKLFPRPADDATAATRAVATGRICMIPDVDEDPHYVKADLSMVGGFRSVIAVPLMRNHAAVGAIAVARRHAGLVSESQLELLQTFADQAMIAIENVRLFNDTKEALERQTATSEILRVISRSPMDVHPVFDTIALAALKLCRAISANVFRFDGRLIHLVPLVHSNPGYIQALRQVFPRPLGADTAVGRAILRCRVVAVPDVLEDAEYAIQGAALEGGFRSVLAVPLVREGSAIGAIAVGRPEPGPFPPLHVSLLQTFADQAVIAIENVRLFTETNEALERQTATSEILRVISQSPTDVQPVFDTIARSVLSLCNARFANVFTYDGNLIHLAAIVNVHEHFVERMRKLYPRPPGRGTAIARAIAANAVCVIPDVLDDPDYDSASSAATGGFRSVLAVPLLRKGKAIGGLSVGRPEPGDFPSSQIALLQIFADQAVIAIENVRLFNDTKEALERQTATSEILRVISQSPRDVQPVFDIIVENAVRLCAARYGAVFRLDGGLVHLAAHHNLSEKLFSSSGFTSYPMPPNRGHVSGRTILAGAAVQVPDILADEEYLGAGMKSLGFRSLLGVPLLRGGRAIGAIVIYRMEPGQFADKHVELLQTFADQAVIAVENVRLFTELEARTRDLSRSVGELKALGEIGQAVSSTLDLPTVLSTIVSRATKLAGMDGGAIFEYDEAREAFHLRATDGLPGELEAAIGAGPIPKGEGAIGSLALTGEPVQIRDILDEGSYQSRVRETLLRVGHRSLLAVPLLREDRVLGGLVVNRKRSGDFSPEVIELLKTFATQSSLAIQNARLYREIEMKSRELEAASRHKSEFLANMSHELRTPLNAIIGFSEVLAERMFGEINEKQAEYIGDILQSGQHLLSLINDILDLSKIEAGRMELELSEFDVPGLIENTMTLVRERAIRRGIALGRSIDERLGTMRADERKVKQVLLNLLSNALKFTPEGGKITVRAAANDGAAEISVTDTGVGIAAEDQDAVFDEFRQVGAASKKAEGTGLGLAISRKFIELHGGRIWVSSKVGSGSTFTFTLPQQVQ